MKKVACKSKKLSQYWLTNPATIKHLVNLIPAHSDVLEIGCGSGNITQALLLTKYRSFCGIEIDQHLTDKLVQRFPNANIRCQDIMKLDYAELPKNLVVVSNVPYHLTKKLLMQLADYQDRLLLVVLMIARSNADKILTHNNPTGCLMSFYFEVRDQLTVLAIDSTPTPQVDSKILTLHKRDDNLHVAPQKLKHLLSIIYARKHQKCLNALKKHYPDSIKFINLNPCIRTHQLKHDHVKEIVRHCLVTNSNTL